jgi:hypothetical protein
MCPRLAAGRIARPRLPFLALRRDCKKKFKRMQYVVQITAKKT